MATVLRIGLCFLLMISIVLRSGTVAATTTSTQSTSESSVPASSTQTTTVHGHTMCTSSTNGSTGCGTNSITSTQSTTTRKKKIKDFDVHDPELELRTDIETALNSEEFNAYIASLTDDFQKDLIRRSLRYCPFTPLCGVSLGLNYNTYYIEFYPTGPSRRLPCCDVCSCDPLCASKGLCCPDAPRRVPTTVDKRVLSDGVTEMCLQRGIPDGGNDLNDRVERIKALVGCPDGTNDELRSKCTRNYARTVDELTLSDVTFVSDPESETIYRNKYCGLCNGLSSRFMIFWQPELHCQFSSLTFSSTSEILPKILNGGGSCDLNFRIPDELQSHVDSCSTFVSTCNVTGLWREYNRTIEDACDAYGTPIAIPEINGKSPLFRNAFCALCNGYTPKDEDKCYPSSDYTERYSFSGLLRLEERESSDDGKQTQCPPGTLYDSIMRKCRQVHCASGRELVDGKCLTVVDIRAETYELTVRFTAMTDVFLFSAYHFTPAFTMWLSDTIQKAANTTNIIPCVPQAALTFVNTTQLYDNSLLHFYDIRYRFFVRKHNVTRLTETLLQMNGTYVVLDNGFVSEVKDMTHEIQNSFNGYQFRLNVIDTDKLVFNTVEQVQRSMKFTDTIMFSLENALNNSDEMSFVLPFTAPKQLNTYCALQAPNILSNRACPMFSIPWIEFQWKISMYGLESVDKHVHLDISEYAIEVDDDANSKSFFICADLYLERFLPFMITSIPDQTDNTAEMIVSIVFISLSIVSLLVSMLTYCIFAELRTLPGRNNMALIASLLAAQGMYVISNFGGFDRGSMACQIAGVATHFCWLMTIFWMQICTFHMFRVLSRIRATPSPISNKRYLLYHVYCGTLSAICIAVNVVVSMVTSEYSDMGYGTRTCYISSQRMIEVTFGIPAAFVILSNIVMFLTIVVKLKRAPSVQKSVRNERNYFLVFAKLSTVTGATWLFGFVYMWSGIEVFAYIFIVLNASQGVFILIGFVCKRRTLDLYKDKTNGQCSTVSENVSNRTNSTSF